MELRHLRCFQAVAEELHFARAAERLHIEQSPLSRAIKELEEDLGVQLFVRTTRSTRLTRAGRLFQHHVPRVFAALEQARDSAKAAAQGFNGQLRIALSDCTTPSRLPALAKASQCPARNMQICHGPYDRIGHEADDFGPLQPLLGRFVGGRQLVTRSGYWTTRRSRTP